MELNSVKETGILIVGAGPTGLALACDLARRGVHAHVVEQSPDLFPGSRGKGIQPRTMEVFDDLGVVDAVLASGGPAPVGMVWQDGTRQGAHDMFERPEATAAAPYGEPWLLPQWRTQQILHARLTELGGEVSFGVALNGLTQDEHGVTAELSAGTVRAAYAVAADGGRSTVRRILGIAMTGETVDPAPMLVADVRIPALDRLNWHVFPGGEAGFLSVCPLPGTDDFQIVGQFTEGEPDISPAGVRELVAARTHLTAADVTEVLWSSDFRPRAAMADRFREGRVFLAGDAAHVHSPAGGQGLNTSVQDAYNLGWKLGQVLRHGAPESLLDSYEQEREPVAAEMLGLSTRIHRGEQRRGAATMQLGLGYRGGPLAMGSAGALEAGDRAPDGPLPDGRRLFDLFRGPHFTLLAVGTDIGLEPLDAELEAELERAQAHVHRIDAYEPYGKGLFLVRPDGYVGWAGEDTTGLTDFLERVRCR
ncbi:FAD-dependent oxidoreductase [Streptomyces lunaelactis]|uniref:FAD-dependent oxidoreductase n=1 Tax=Streptomyces lunaelactis TaxID=1535768 RepID=UPI0015852B4A|nr:FAD-dependent oxidoreductase [Streptomyces lunaelactis]NUK34535.1 FAD-dependent oxidoreductase [Streptomyces lunaelactis]NUK46342.1 FAD-dependent oxidoreductase [Streptomyces lunaelactis]NUK91615.1 FAD-dependent oxidoreductase [Streptomyces lunaelactis]NUL31969.1 FAD-dependent oxidoreductase [Streptomyces lunaelactis]